MLAARKFESFCVDPTERWVLAGNLSGQIAVIDVDRFRVVRQVQVNVGSIHAVDAHRELPYVATLSADRTVSVLTLDGDGRLRPLCTISTRDIRCTNDEGPVAPVHSVGQALAFHGKERRLVTRTGGGGVLELEFEDDGTCRVRSCVRLHGTNDVASTGFVQDSDQVLSLANNGEVVLSHRGAVIRRWQFGHETAHWAEHVSGTDYLIASDTRGLIRLDISGERPPVVGPLFARDDLEHVTYNRTSGRAFASSFDRTVREVDAETCVPLDVVFPAPFKLRWIKTLERAPSTMVVQCRDGGLYKVDVDRRECIAAIRDTPATLWTAVAGSRGELLLAGEGDLLVRLSPASMNPLSRKITFAVDRAPFGVPATGYTKRMVRQASTGRLICGRTDGTVLVGDGRRFRRLAELGAAVRDLAVAPERSELFVGTEDGRIGKIDLDSGAPLLAYRSPAGEPIWSLAYNPARDLLAFSEREGSLTILSGADFRPVVTGIPSRRSKRMKWADDDTLLFGKSTELFRLDLKTGTAACLVETVGNTIEDFIWDVRRQYLVLASYTRYLILCDYHSGVVLDAAPDQIDYSKGLIAIEPVRHPDAYPLDFLSFGRSGTAHHFRILDEKIFALGPVGEGEVAGLDAGGERGGGAEGLES